MRFAPYRLLALHLARVSAIAVASFFLTLVASANSDVTIKGGGNKGGKYSGTNPKIFTPKKVASVAGAGGIKTYLNGGRSVTVTTASAFEGAGDLTVAVEIAKTGKKKSTLALHAERDLFVNKPLRATKSAFGIELRAGRILSLNAPITTKGGDIAIQAGEPFVISAAVDAGAGKIVILGGSVESSTAQTLTAANVEVAEGSGLRILGTITGNLSVSGGLSAGTLAASNLQVGGSLELKQGSSLKVNLGGASKYGKITANGAVTLGGTITLDCIDGFEDLIVPGNSFPIITGASVTGTFEGIANGDRVMLPDELGSLKVNYTSTSVVLSDWQPVIVDLPWDPGTADAGTEVYTNARLRGKRHYFRVHCESTDIGAWRTRLTPAAEGEADVYMRLGSLPATNSSQYRSNRVGADGFVLNGGQFDAAEEWFILVYADVAKPWSILSGRAYVTDLGLLPWTDVDGNGAYQIGEPPLPHGSGPLPIYGEGMRFYKATLPAGTPAWSLWLNGLNKSLAVKSSEAPFHSSTLYYDRKQNGQMLVVPPVLPSGLANFFVSVVGDPGDVINLDSRIQEVSDIPYNSTVQDVDVPAAPYRVYRVNVPPEQIAWDVSTTPLEGNPNIAIRRGDVAAEYDNDAYSEVGGQVRDSITVVPNFLTDGAWYITVYGPSAYRFTLRNGPPDFVPIQFTDTKVNDEPLRAGWKFFALTNIEVQLGTYGWMLELANQVPGTEIALRRNAVPSRWRQRKDGVETVKEFSVVEYSGKRGFLERPAHQPDVWYAGIYMPTEALGSFTLSTRPIEPPLINFDGGSRQVSNLEAGRWAFVRVNVPSGVLGWDVRVRNVTGAVPVMAVRHDLLPEIFPPAQLGNIGGLLIWKDDHWATGSQWRGTLDWTGYSANFDGSGAGPGMVTAMGRALEPGSYYVGVLNTSTTESSSFTIESRGIGAGQSYTVTPLAYDSGSSTITDLAPREPRYFKTTIPPNTPSWELLVDATVGDVMLMASRNFIPDFDGASQHSIYRSDHHGEQTEIKKFGHERYVMLPRPGEMYLREGDIYLAVVSEGVNPTTTASGTDTSSAVIHSAGPLAITAMGTATPTGISIPVTLVPGQVKAFHFNVPPDTVGLEMRLLDPLGSPVQTVIPGAELPTPEIPSEHGVYGIDGGWLSTSNTGLITASNPPAGTWSVLVHAPPTGEGASATLNVIARGKIPLAFDGGAVSITDQTHGTWRYFHINVPENAVGWDIRLRDVVGAHPPLMVRRTLAPSLVDNRPSFIPPPWRPHTGWTWPHEFQWLATADDWTGYASNADGLAVPDRIVAGMKRPLEPGVYLAGVYNNTGANVAYTIDSRGIGDGLTYPVTNLAYAGGTSQITNLAPREARYFRVTVPENTPSWEVVLTPEVGELELLARYQAIPDFLAIQDGSIYLGDTGGEVEMKKVGPERYVLLPNEGAEWLAEGDYYLAVVSEGVSPSSGRAGTETCSAQLTSSPLAVKDLGIPTAEGTREAVALDPGQIRAYEVTVPANTLSLEVRLDNPIGNPQISLAEKTKLPIPAAFGPNPKYGWNSGKHGLTHNNIITVANPPEGTWSILVRGGQSPQSTTFGPSSAELVVTALTTVPLNFDGGSYTITNQGPASWRYFVVNVPAEALGWDIRLRDVSGAIPALLVRRDQIPFIKPNGSPANEPGWNPTSSATWPTGHQWLGVVDWTGYLSKTGDPAGPPGIVAPMGRPLEPGTYFIGVFNHRLTPTSYTIASRGIGPGLHYDITELAFAGGTGQITELPAREPKYFKVAIPEATQSWELSVQPTFGDLQLAIRSGHVPDFHAPSGGTIHSSPPQLKLRKEGNERYVLLSNKADDLIPAGEYFIAAISDGANPNRTGNIVGSGTSSGVLTSHGLVEVPNLGSASEAGVSQDVTLVSSQMKAFQFDVPAGTDTLEIRQDNVVGYPKMTVASGSRVPTPAIVSGYGGVNGGASGTTETRFYTVMNPKAGLWSMAVRATEAPGGSLVQYPDASATIVIRQKQNLSLSFDASLNQNGVSHTDEREAIDGEYHVYKVTPPATMGGEPVLGWIIRTEVIQGAASVRVFKDFANPNAGIQRPAGTMVVVPPFLTFDQPWYVRVEATGNTQYRITSRALTLERPAWQMPEGHNTTFGDSGTDQSGNPLPGDRGIDLEQGGWHFYAVDVPENNSGLFRTVLEGISGNPDLYIREDGVPTTDHNAAGAGGVALVHRTLTNATTSYGNWVPTSGRTETRLRPGRWYLGVRAGNASNVRYRLVLSTGTVREMAIDPSSATAQVPSEVTSQALADNDWRYYRFTVPENAPQNWKLTFGQSVGDVVMWIRDTVPPGQKKLNANTNPEIADMASDNKNQGPYVGRYELPGEHTLTTPPLRPGHTYYVGFRSNNSAVFSFGSAASSETIEMAPILDFYTGSLDTTIPAFGSLQFRIPAPPEATRFKYTSTHDSSVKVRIEQGTVTTLDGTQHYVTTSANSSRSQPLSQSSWPWQAGQTYYVRFVNTSALPQPIVFTLSGKNALTDDEDADQMLDAWEMQHFGNLSQNRSGDPDGDGVTTGVEYDDGTEPNNVASAKYALTIGARNGTVTAEPQLTKYDRGSLVSLSSSPNAGYDFLCWSGGPFRTDDYALRATGTISVPTSGTWTFGIHSGDGARLIVNGVTVITDGTAHEPRAAFGQITLNAGTYAVELLAYERTSGESLELFAATGSFTSFQPEFRIVGDVVNGGLAVHSTVDGEETPGFIVRQVALPTGIISSLASAETALNSTAANRLDTTGIIESINFLDFLPYEGFFGNNAHFPLTAQLEDETAEIAMISNYTVLALYSLPLGVGTDAEQLTWQTGGHVPWLAENDATAAFDGVDVAVSGPIGDNQNSMLETLVQGPGTLRFRWRVSSLSGDNFVVALNATNLGTISGETLWAERSITIPVGVHRVKWTYTKNSTGSAGSDRAYLDQVTFTP